MPLAPLSKSMDAQLISRLLHRDLDIRKKGLSLTKLKILCFPFESLPKSPCIAKRGRSYAIPRLEALSQGRGDAEAKGGCAVVMFFCFQHTTPYLPS
jgi:hypothetical protein